MFLYALKKALEKFKFKLYALCIMSNHVHYLMEPIQPEDLPKIMHWLNWYTATPLAPPLLRGDWGVDAEPHGAFLGEAVSQFGL